MSKRGPIVCVNCDLSDASDILQAAHTSSSSTPLKDLEGTLERGCPWVHRGWPVCRREEWPMQSGSVSEGACVLVGGRGGRMYEGLWMCCTLIPIRHHPHPRTRCP